MSANSALRLLQTAIQNVRDECDSSEYKSLISACSKADQEAEKALKSYDDSESEPRNLKDAAAETRRQFADRRKSGGE